MRGPGERREHEYPVAFDEVSVEKVDRPCVMWLELERRQLESGGSLSAAACGYLGLGVDGRLKEDGLALRRSDAPASRKQRGKRMCVSPSGVMREASGAARQTGAIAPAGAIETWAAASWGCEGNVHTCQGLPRGCVAATGRATSVGLRNSVQNPHQTLDFSVRH